MCDEHKESAEQQRCGRGHWEERLCFSVQLREGNKQMFRGRSLVRVTLRPRGLITQHDAKPRPSLQLRAVENPYITSLVTKEKDEG